MPVLDEVAPNYARAAARWADAQTLGAGHASLRNCYAGDGHGLVEHVKAFIESTCRTILSEFGLPAPTGNHGTPTTTELLGAAFKPVGLDPGQAATSLGRMISGFNKISDALSDLRNAHGPVSHGREGFADKLAHEQSRAFLHAGDAVLGVLLLAYEGKHPELAFTREPYERFGHLNTRIDGSVSVKATIEYEDERQMVVLSITAGLPEDAVRLKLEPSRLLYGVDRSLYVDILRMAGETEVVTAPEELPAALPPPLPSSFPELTAEGESLASAPVAPVAPDPPAIDTTASPPDFVSGDLRSTLNEIPGFASTPLQTDDVDSLLEAAKSHMGADWKIRDALQAAMRSDCSRLLIKKGIDPAQARSVASVLVEWLTKNTPDEEVAQHAEQGESAALRG